MSNPCEIVQLLEHVLIEHARGVSPKRRGNLEDLFELSLGHAIDVALAAAFNRAQGTSPKHSHALDALVKRIESIERTELPSALGEAFEVLRGQRLAESRGKSLQLDTSPERRKNGIYYTPSHLAEAIAEPAISHALKNVSNVRDLKRVRILDPAAGCGAFLIASLRIATEILHERESFRKLSRTDLRKLVAANCIFGVDIDPVAIAITRALILLEAGDESWSGDELNHHLKVGDAVSAPLASWNEWFPGSKKAGFTVVITNPPWSKLRPLRHEFFEHIDVKVRSLQGTQLGSYLRANLTELVDGGWTDYAERTLSLSANLRSSRDYAINKDSSGDADLYKYFAERALQLLSQGGMAALLLPSGLLRAQGSSLLRSMLRTQGRIQNLTEYINRKKLFDIHSMYRFCSVHFIKGRPGGIEKARFARTTVKNDDDCTRLSKDYLAAVGGPELLVPEVRTSDERDLLLRLYQHFPRAGSPRSDWKFSFRRELDMTNDASHFMDASHSRSHASTERVLPLYEGRMVHQFDHSAKAYGSGHGRSAVWQPSPPNSTPVKPHYFVAEKYAIKKGWRGIPRAGYCEISGHANERTILACLVPSDAVCGNKVPVLKLDHDDVSSHLLWISLANSLVVDWIMRRWVSTTVNQFYWQNIPLPPRTNSHVEQLLIQGASLLHRSSELDTRSLGQRALVRALIDAAVLDLYQVTDRELDVLLDDFPLVASAHRRGPTGSEPIRSLLAKARKALRKTGIEAHSDLERAFGCSAELAAAAYTPRATMSAIV